MIIQREAYASQEGTIIVPDITDEELAAIFAKAEKEIEGVVLDEADIAKMVAELNNDEEDLEHPVRVKVSGMEYSFTQIDDFDARSGYKRCVIPGVVIATPRRIKLVADLWRNRQRQIVVRFSVLDDRYSYSVKHTTGDELEDEDIDDFSFYMSYLLLRWSSEGIDDSPIF